MSASDKSSAEPRDVTHELSLPGPDDRDASADEMSDDRDIAMARRLSRGSIVSLDDEVELEPERPRRWRRALVVGLGLPAALVASLSVLAATTVPTEFIKGRLIAEAEARTGRKVSVNGPTSVSLFPSLSIRLADVTLSSPSDMNVPPLVRVAEIEAETGLISVLLGRLDVAHLILTRPVMELVVDSRGQRSWDIGVVGGPVRIASVDAGGSTVPGRSLSDTASVVTAPPAPRGGTRPHIGEIRIVDGTLRYMDSRTGVAYEASRIRATATCASERGPLEMRALGVFRGEEVTVKATVHGLAASRTRQPERISVSAASRLGEASFSGTLGDTKVVPGPAASYADGSMLLRSALPDALADWLGVETPSLRAPVSITGRLVVGERSLTVRDAEIKVDKASGKGTITVDLTRERTPVNVDLRVATVGLDALLAAGRVVPPKARPTAASMPASTAPVVTVPTRTAIVPPLNMAKKRADAPRADTPPQTMEELIRRTIGETPPRTSR
ncbi:MAG TPA: AsmA family protein [Hyphomicrobiaceae bacterium]|nr:AsmA family protein [Hyphomicrobiaceae bacterium]